MLGILCRILYTKNSRIALLVLTSSLLFRSRPWLSMTSPVVANSEEGGRSLANTNTLSHSYTMVVSNGFV